MFVVKLLLAVSVSEDTLLDLGLAVGLLQSCFHLDVLLTKEPGLFVEDFKVGNALTIQPGSDVLVLQSEGMDELSHIEHLGSSLRHLEHLVGSVVLCHLSEFLNHFRL